MAALPSEAVDAGPFGVPAAGQDYAAPEIASTLTSSGQPEWSGTSTAEEKCQLAAAPAPRSATTATSIASTIQRERRNGRRSTSVAGGDSAVGRALMGTAPRCRAIASFATRRGPRDRLQAVLAEGGKVDQQVDGVGQPSCECLLRIEHEFAIYEGLRTAPRFCRRSCISCL